MTRWTILGVLCISAVASADTIKLKNGGTLEGVIVKEGDGALVVRLKYATVTLDRFEIESIEKKAADPSPAAAPARLPRWDRCIEVVAARPWAGELRQIPATVIDKGILKDVAALRSLNLKPGKTERDGLTFEVTPETAEDAYEGWWISVYSTKLLDEARATEEELKKISVSEEELEKEEQAERQRLAKEAAERKAGKKKEADEKKKAEPKRVEPSDYFGFNPYLFQKQDVQHARKRVNSGGLPRYWVRGYHRPRGAGYTRGRFR